MLAARHMVEVWDAEEAMRRRRRRKKRKEFWVHPMFRLRDVHGHYDNLMAELLNNDRYRYKQFIRMDPGLFQEILRRIEPRIQRKDTKFRKALAAGMKLALTLRYLASGESYPSLVAGFRVSKTMVTYIVPEVCNALIAEYQDEHMKCPENAEEWKEIARGFEKRWNFPHALGALDGKHIRIRNPARAGSLYYNYKGFFSIILMALVDADYRFIWVEVGANGASSDAQIFNSCELKEAILDGSIDFPAPEPIVEGDQDVPYFLIGDDAFALRTWMMKPYSVRGLSREQRIFNYRLSRARRVVENAFGMLASRYRCLLNVMCQPPDTVSTVTLACCLLHNMLRTQVMAENERLVDTDGPNNEVLPGDWRAQNVLLDSAAAMNPSGEGARYSKAGQKVRLYLEQYVNTIGAVTWQNDKI
jgi:hypothetical protein